jgi:hypothetical protein
MAAEEDFGEVGDAVLVAVGGGDLVEAIGERLFAEGGEGFAEGVMGEVFEGLGGVVGGGQMAEGAIGERGGKEVLEVIGCGFFVGGGGRQGRGSAYR